MPIIEGEPYVLVEVDMVLPGDTNRTTYTLDEEGELVRGIATSASEPMLFADMAEALRYMAAPSTIRTVHQWRSRGLAEIRFVFD